MALGVEMFAEWLLWLGLLMKMLITFGGFVGSVSPNPPFLSFSPFSFPLALYAGPCIYRGVGVHENGKGQPFNQAFKAMRQESDILKDFLF